MILSLSPPKYSETVGPCLSLSDKIGLATLHLTPILGSSQRIAESLSALKWFVHLYCTSMSVSALNPLANTAGAHTCILLYSDTSVETHCRNVGDSGRISTDTKRAMPRVTRIN